MAPTAGIPARAADAAIDELTKRFATGLDQIILPDVPNLAAEITAKAEQMLELCRARIAAWRYADPMPFEPTTEDAQMRKERELISACSFPTRILPDRKPLKSNNLSSKTRR